jgi:drug/metabolite transporter (DMT)-like permease
MIWPLLLGLPEHAKPVVPHDCLLLLGIATSSFFAQLLMTRAFQIIPAARAAAVSFTGETAGTWMF